MLSEWKELWGDIKKRMHTIGAPSRLMYFIIVVIGVGGLGAWRAATTDLFRTNLATYAMGISAAAAVELVLPPTASRALRMLAISLGILACAASLTFDKFECEGIVWIGAACGWLFVLRRAVSISLENPPEGRRISETGGSVLL